MNDHPRPHIRQRGKSCLRGKFNADRKRFMAEAHERNDGGWTIHTEHHWSRTVAGHRLDYWPSRKKFQYRGKVRRGDVVAFIARKEAPMTPTPQDRRPSDD